MELEAGFRIGAREVFPLEGRIVGPDGSLRVEPKSMAVLMDLARHAQSVRPRELIVQVVWPRGFVTDDALTRCIGQLRRALGDDPRSPALLETIPKIGYRLRADVQPVGATPIQERPSSRAVESLIVLPFQNLSATDQDFVADGITELLILRLASLRGVRVISRTTAMQFRGTTTSVADIAARTGSDWVIEGSVLQSGDRLQVVAQLIDARTDAHTWAADFVRDLGDILTLQNEIVRRVAAAIRQQLGADFEPLRQTVSLPPAMMRSYLRGRHLHSQRTLQALADALRCFAEVTATEPDFAAGWASRAECEMLLAHYGAQGRARLLEECDRDLERALTLEPDLAIALSTRGAVRFFFRRDLDGAAADLQRALSSLPSYSLAMLSMANVWAVRGRFDEATAWLEQALLVDPLDVGINMNLGDHMILQRRYEAAAQALRQALQLQPRHRPSQLRLCWALALAGRPSEAVALLEDVRAASGAGAQWHEFAALVASACGDAAAAGQHYDALRSTGAADVAQAWALARAAAAAGRVSEAIEWLEVAVQQRSSSVPFMFITPAFDRLHADPRFLALCAELPRPAVS